MSQAPFRFRLNGALLQPHQSGALFWPDEKTLIVADLHLEKAASLAANGQFLPPYDTIETLDLLDELLIFFEPKRLIALGDSFHDRFVAHHLNRDTLARIQRLSAKIDLVWVTGNHDPEMPAHLGGRVVQDIDFNALHFRHEASPLFVKAGEISGHYHPKATILIRKRRYTGPAFVADERRLILPAFGTFTGGLWVHNPAIFSLFTPKMRVFLCTQRRVLPLTMHSVIKRQT